MMPGIAGVRTEFLQGTGYELASEAVFLNVVRFVFGGLQSSAAQTFIAATARVVQRLI